MVWPYESKVSSSLVSYHMVHCPGSFRGAALILDRYLDSGEVASRMLRTSQKGNSWN